VFGAERPASEARMGALLVKIQHDSHVAAWYVVLRSDVHSGKVRALFQYKSSEPILNGGAGKLGKG
jgi:hypothetical protein